MTTLTETIKMEHVTQYLAEIPHKTCHEYIKKLHRIAEESFAYF